MMPYIVASLFGHGAVRVAADQPHVLGTGSIISFATASSVIWGSGMLSQHETLADLSSHQFRAVRGQRTADALTGRGRLRAEVCFGDPGVFAAEIAAHFGIDPAVRGKPIVVIPHHHFANHRFFGPLYQSKEVAVVEPFDNSLNFFRTISQGNVVISQSLHGLIIAEALGKPSLWISAVNDENWDFKFQDWFSTTANPQKESVSFADADSAKDLGAFVDAAEIRRSTIDKKSLRDAFPTAPELYHSAEYFDFQTLRRLLPLTTLINSNVGRCEVFEAIPPDTLTEMTRDALMGLRNTFQACPERGYCYITTPAFSKQITPEQLSVICRIMDLDTLSDYVTIIDSRYAPTDAKFSDFGYGIRILADRKLLGGAFCVRADFNGFNGKFLTLII
jgi:hypothetical protein